MTPRRALIDRLLRRTGPGHSNPTNSGTAEPSWPTPVPLPPTRMVVSGETGPDGKLPFDIAPRPTRTLDPRLRLWRDTAAILIVFALVVAFSGWLPRTEQAVLTATGAPSGTIAGGETLAPGPTPGPGGSPAATPEPSLAPGQTARPGATPTPQPGTSPTATSSASPSPGASPIASDTPPPTGTPAVTDTPPPPPPPTPTPAPAPPVAVISVSPSCASPNHDITFDGSASVGATDYVWDFGDGVTSTLLIEVHAFWPPDTYHVTLRVSGPGGIDTDTVDVQVPC